LSTSYQHTRRAGSRRPGLVGIADPADVEHDIAIPIKPTWRNPRRRLDSDMSYALIDQWQNTYPHRGLRLLSARDGRRH
jgi:hypothetical protein